ncbi:MAG: thioredoxin-like domain-containing protein [Spirosomataceae bacterium]
MKRILLSISLLLSIAATTNAQHSIKAKIKGAPSDKTCYLAHFFGYNQYIKVDSAKVQDGVLNFNGDEKLKGGIYLIVLSPSKYYDFAVSGDEQNFEIEADTADFVGTAKFTGSKENQILFGYRKFLKQKGEEAEALNKVSSIQNDPVSKEMSRKRVENIQKEVDDYQKKVIAENPNSFASKVLLANIDPEMPKELPKKADGRPDSTYLFNYYKNNYFKNIDFSDDRFLRTPFIHSKIERYFRDLVYQVQDSVIRDADRILKLSKKNPEVYRYALWFITNKYENPEIVGLDGVFIHLAENYYLKDATWLDSTQRAKFQERVTILKPLQTNFVFPSLVVSDTLGREHTIMQSKSKYTIVYFYDPDCGHCKESAPKLVEFYNKNKGRVTIYNVSVAYDLKKMKEFIRTYKTGSMINVWDAKGKYYFKNNFDVYSTPTTYVLDENKRIIAKRIPADKFEDFISFYEKQQASKNSNGKTKITP